MAGDRTKVMPELRLSIDSFRRSAYHSGLQAIAARAQVLLLMEPGTCVDNFDMGVGIGTYLFEILDDGLIARLELRISTQLREYLPDILIEKVTVAKAEAETIERATSVLNVVITLQKALDGVKAIIYQVFKEDDGTTHGEFFV